MAILTKQATGESFHDPDEIQALLATHGVVFEQWDISRYDPRSLPAGSDESEYILRTFAPEVQALSQARGYTNADVIALTPETPNLDAICAKFDKEHTHTDDEVRFVVHGRGVFAIRGNDGELYDIEMHPGDVIVVPEGAQHYFFLKEDRTIQCIRLFTDAAGWVANYV